MKKKIFTLLALFAGVLGAYADNTITVSEALIPAGKNGSFNIELSNTDQFKGFTMFLTLPTGVSLVSVTNNPDRLNALEDPTGSNPYGLGYIAMSPIAGTSGTIVTVTVKADESLAGGSKLDAKLDKITFGKSDGSGDVVIADVNFQIEITDKIVIDENSTVLPAAQSGVDVLVKRTLKKDVWNTIVLPITMTKAQVEAAFGSDVKVATLDSWTPTINEITLIPTAIKLNFETYTMNALKKFKAGNMYIVKPSKDIENFEVSGVDITTAIEETTIKDKDYDLNATFTGSLIKAVVPNKALFISGNKFWYSTGKTNIKGMRGWFVLGAVIDEAVAAPEITFVVDGETTRVEGLNTIVEDGNYYNLNGMKVENPTKKGVYIKNGKKIVVK